MTRLARPGVARLRFTTASGRRDAMPYRSRRERAALVQAIAAAQQNAAWMAEQARLGWPLFDAPETIAPAQADELRAMWEMSR